MKRMLLLSTTLKSGILEFDRNKVNVFSSTINPFLFKVFRKCFFSIFVIKMEEKI